MVSVSVFHVVVPTGRTFQSYEIIPPNEQFNVADVLVILVADSWLMDGEVQDEVTGVVNVTELDQLLQLVELHLIFTTNSYCLFCCKPVTSVDPADVSGSDVQEVTPTFRYAHRTESAPGAVHSKVAEVEVTFVTPN